MIGTFRWGCFASFLVLAVTAAMAEEPGKAGRNARICADLEQEFRIAGGDENSRKLNFYLFDAAERGCLTLTANFLAAGADLAARDRFGNTALNIAARKGHDDVIDYLIEQGADQAKPNLAGSTPLLRAVESDRRRAVKALLKANADPNVANLKGIRPLAAAAFNGNDRMVALLLEHGADPHHADRTGKTAIVYAAGKGYGGIVEQFLAAGVSADVPDGHQLTPLMWAAGHSNDVPAKEALATIELLLGAGAEINHRDDRGRDALMIASERGHGDVVRHLIDAGADPKATDREGKSAVDLAANPSIRSLLDGV